MRKTAVSLKDEETQYENNNLVETVKTTQSQEKLSKRESSIN